MAIFAQLQSDTCSPPAEREFEFRAIAPDETGASVDLTIWRDGCVSTRQSSKRFQLLANIGRHHEKLQDVDLIAPKLDCFPRPAPTTLQMEERVEALMRIAVASIVMFAAVHLGTMSHMAAHAMQVIEAHAAQAAPITPPGAPTD